MDGGIRVAKFDVLADAVVVNDGGGGGPSFSFDKYRRHIGNVQFSIVAGLYHEPYNAVGQGEGSSQEECDLIATRLIDLWTHKGVEAVSQRGRFLVSVPADDSTNGDGSRWKPADDVQMDAIVRTFLKEDPMAESEEEALILDAADTLDSLNVANLKAQNSDIDGGLIDDDDSGIGIINTAGAFDAPVLNDEKKRPRRRSLLRRSVSEAAVMDKKKSQRQEGTMSSASDFTQFSGLRTSGSNTVSSFDDSSSGFFNVSKMRKSLLDSTGDFATEISKAIKMDDIEDDSEPTPLPTPMPTPMPTPVSTLTPNIQTPNGSSTSSGMMNINLLTHLTGNNNSVISAHGNLDVILSGDCRHLSSSKNHVGNNRLLVMLTLQRGRYPTMSPLDQTKAAIDLVKMVCNSWGGRVLVEVGLSFLELTFNQAVTAMKALLSQNPAPAPAPPAMSMGGKPSAPSGVPSNPFSFPQPLAMSSNSRATSCPPSSVQFGAPAMGVAARQTSIDLISQPLNHPGAEDRQKAARSSLQQRKVKRGLAKRLGKGSLVLPNGGQTPSSFSSLNNSGSQG